MNEANIHTRLTEIVKAAMEADTALATGKLKQLDVSLNVIEIHLRAIRAEMAELLK